MRDEFVYELFLLSIAHCCILEESHIPTTIAGCRRFDEAKWAEWVSHERY
jgi:hypothetical protein